MIKKLFKNIFKKKPKSFVFHSKGRNGEIKYKNKGRVIYFYWEMSGVPDYHILLSPLVIGCWHTPSSVRISKKCQLELLYDLRKYLGEEKIKSDIQYPLNDSISVEDCIFKDCLNKRYEKFGYCPEHYDGKLIKDFYK